METPKISILVPIFNVESYLRKCLDSLIEQSLKEIEIICINDGSTDSSLEIIKEYAKNDSRFKIIDKANSGYGDSMNRGLDIANGDYIGILEPDDFAELDMFESLYSLAINNNADLVKSDFFIHTDYSKFPTPIKNIPEKDVGKVINPKINQTILIAQPAIWSAIYRRSLIENNRVRFLSTPGASFQDTAFNFKVLALADRVVLTDSPYIHYRIDNSNSSVKSQDKVFTICGEYEEIGRFLTEHPDIKEQIESRFNQIRYRGYTWNLQRLTPALQYEFFERVVKDLQDAHNEGLLKPSVFDEEELEDIDAILSNPEHYFESTYGPIRVDKSIVIDIKSTDEQTKDYIANFVNKFDKSVELLCLCKNWDAQALYMFEKLRAADKRVFIFEEYADRHGHLELLSKERLRGDKIVFCDTSSRIATHDILETLSCLDENNLDVIVNAGDDIINSSVTVFNSYDELHDALGVLPIGAVTMTRSFFDDENLLIHSANTLDVFHLTHAQSFGLKILSFKRHEPKLEQYMYPTKLDRFVKSWSDFDKYLQSIEGADHPYESWVKLLKKLSETSWHSLKRCYETLDFGSSKDARDLGKALDNSKYPVAIFDNNHNLDADYDMTVVIPVYNAKRFLDGCLKTIRRQSLKKLQIICVNDSSTDESLSILEQHAKEDSRVLVISVLNGGAGLARNKGLEYARGNYISFMDADDYYYEDTTLEKLYSAAIQNNAKLCGGSFLQEDALGFKITDFVGEFKRYKFTSSGFSDFSEHQYDFGWIRFIYDSNLLDDQDLRFSYMRYYEDPVFFLKVAEKAGSFYHIPDVVYCYRDGYKSERWALAAVADCLRGVSMNLDAASHLGYSTLYNILIERLESMYLLPIDSYRAEELIFLLLSEINLKIDCDILNKARGTAYEYYSLSCFDAYRGIGNMIMEHKSQETSTIQSLAIRIEHSRPYEALYKLRRRISNKN